MPSTAKQNQSLDDLWESIGHMDSNGPDPGALAVRRHLAAGRPVYGRGEGLAPDEMVRTNPDGSQEVVRMDGDNDIVMRPY